MTANTCISTQSRISSQLLQRQMQIRPRATMVLPVPTTISDNHRFVLIISLNRSRGIVLICDNAVINEFRVVDDDRRQ